MKKNGSNIISNGPTHTDTIDINEDHDKVSEDGDEGKSIHGARSTDLIFLKSVVLTNTLERPKKVKLFFLTFILFPKNNLMQ